jgi:uncharacterized repeat protein (TIGR03943 family)
VSRLVRGLLLLALAGLIGKLLLTGQMGLYLSPAFDPLSELTGAVLAAMGAHQLWSAMRTRRVADAMRARVGAPDARFDPRSHPGADAGHHGSRLDEALSYALVLLPVGLGLLTAPRALDPNALGGQDATRVVVAYSPTPPSSSVGPPLQPIRDVADLFSYLRTAGEGGVGQPVHLVGMVARGDTLSADQFVLLRYSIVHCVADAQPLGLLIDLPDTTNGASTAAWVEVDGTLASTQRGGAHLISVLATRVAPTSEPPDPYLQTFY